MATYFYLSMVPESLVASMLPPEEFGAYLAIGTRKRSQAQAIFFDLKGEFPSDHFDFSLATKRCIPHSDGQPKHSLYLGIYRVLEHVPLEVINNLWLVVPTGQALELKPGSIPPEFSGKYHLYQEICPVHSLIASLLTPDKFCQFITDPARPVFVPRICFVDLELAELAVDPHGDLPTNLPYTHLDHVRDCLLELEGNNKYIKTVDRIHPQEFPYRCVKSGFFLGNQKGMLYYPFPSRKELESKYYPWWRFANR